MADPEYILFTKEGLYKMLGELEITAGSRLDNTRSVEVIESKIEEHRVHWIALQVSYPDQRWVHGG